MDLGIAGRTALVCASSQGLGLACARALAREGCHIFINGRDGKKLDAAAKDIRTVTDVEVVTIVADLNSGEGRQPLIDACPNPDILINNNAGPAPGNFLEWGREQWLLALEANMLAAIHLMQVFVPGMRERKFGRIVNVTSAMVKSPAAHMSLSTSARAALTAASKALSREVAVDNVTINNLLPERIDTGRQKFMVERLMKQENIDHGEARRRIVATIPAGRFGDATEFGDACAFLCSAQAGFISGQNLQLDGGAYRGLI